MWLWTALAASTLLLGVFSLWGEVVYITQPQIGATIARGGIEIQNRVLMKVHGYGWSVRWPWESWGYAVSVQGVKWGPDWSVAWQSRLDHISGAWTIRLPLALPLILFTTFAWWCWRKQRSPRPNHCPCGYNLAGLPADAPCPECGQAAKSA